MGLVIREFSGVGRKYQQKTDSLAVSGLIKVGFSDKKSAFCLCLIFVGRVDNNNITYSER